MKSMTRLLAVLAVLACCSTRYVEASPRLGLLQGLLDQVHSLQTNWAPAADEAKRTMLVEYDVPPPVKGKFLSAFDGLSKAVEHADSVKVFKLAKPMDNNLQAYQYSEWDGSVHDESLDKAFDTYFDELATLGVIYKAHFLKQVIKPIKPSSQSLSTAKGNEGNTTSIGVTYVVPPPVGGKFKSAFEALAKVAGQEPGLLFMGLEKPMDSNEVYYGYSTWETPIHYDQHTTGEAFKAFAAALGNLGVIYKAQFLKTVSNVVHP